MEPSLENYVTSKKLVQGKLTPQTSIDNCVVGKKVGQNYKKLSGKLQKLSSMAGGAMLKYTQMLHVWNIYLHLA